MSIQRPKSTMERTYTEKALLDIQEELVENYHHFKEEYETYANYERIKRGSVGDGKLSIEILERQTPRPKTQIENKKKDIAERKKKEERYMIQKEKNHYLMKATERQLKEIQTALVNLKPQTEDE